MKVLMVFFFIILTTGMASAFSNDPKEACITHHAIFIFGDGTPEQHFNLRETLQNANKHTDTQFSLLSYSQHILPEQPFIKLDQQVKYTLTHQGKDILKILFKETDRYIHVESQDHCVKLANLYTAYPYPHLPTYVPSCHIRLRCQSRLGDIELMFKNRYGKNCWDKPFQFQENSKVSR